MQIRSSGVYPGGIKFLSVSFVFCFPTNSLILSMPTKALLHFGVPASNPLIFNQIQAGDQKDSDSELFLFH